MRLSQEVLCNKHRILYPLYSYGLGEDNTVVKLVPDLIRVKAEHGYPIKKLGINCTQTSSFDLWYDAMNYWLGKGLMPQTLDEAAGIRFCLDGANESSDFQYTRTLVGIVRENMTTWRLYPFEPQTEHLLRSILEMSEIKSGGYYIDISLSENLGKEISRFDPKRQFIVQNEPQSFNVVPTKNDNYQTCEYAQSKEMQGLMPRHAYLNAATIHKSGYDNGSIWCDLAELAPKMMRILPSGLGSVESKCIFIYADKYFPDGGQSRAVVSMKKRLSRY